MKNLSCLLLLFIAALASANIPISQFPPPPPAPDFTVTTSDGQVRKLYQDYISQQKLVVIEAFFTSCPPCATHAPLFQNLYTSMQAAHPGQVEFIMLSTLFSDTNAKVAQYRTSKGLTMPGAGKDGGSITALQPYLDGQFGQFQGTPTFIVIAPGSGAVFFDIRGNSPTQTIALLQQKIEEFFPTECIIENPFGSALDNVNIMVNGASFDTNFVAGSTYSLSNIAPLQNIPYTLKVQKTGNPVGLTTYDLVLISKHILAIEPFTCPWQILASDVNCTGSITTFDIVTARKVILGILDSFPCGAWRFMPDSALVTNGACQDFVGVKLGDVNAGPCSDSLAAISNDRAKPLDLYFREHEFQAGETARIPLFFMENVALDGLQCAFDFDPNTLEINTIDAETLTGFDEASFRLSNHDLVLSWLQLPGHYFQAKSALLTLNITAPLGGRLSDLLHVSQSGLLSEFYDSEGRIRPIQLLTIPAVSAHFVSPNPANGYFTLHYTASHAEDFSIQMLDVQGKVVLEKTFPGIQGLNSWHIETNGESTGLYFLKVNGEAAAKVVVNR